MWVPALFVFSALISPESGGPSKCYWAASPNWHGKTGYDVAAVAKGLRLERNLVMAVCLGGCARNRIRAPGKGQGLEELCIQRAKEPKTRSIFSVHMQTGMDVENTIEIVDTEAKTSVVVRVKSGRQSSGAAAAGAYSDRFFISKKLRKTKMAQAACRRAAKAILAATGLTGEDPRMPVTSGWRSDLERCRHEFRRQGDWE